MTFAQKLESIRLEKGYSQKELAALINVSQPTYWAYERENSIPHKNTQIQIAKVLNLSLEEFWSDIDEEVKKDEGNCEGSCEIAE